MATVKKCDICGKIVDNYNPLFGVAKFMPSYRIPNVIEYEMCEDCETEIHYIIKRMQNDAKEKEK